LRPQSNAVDDRNYRTEAEVDEWRARDPIVRLERYLLEQGLISAADVAGFRREIDAEVEQATLAAERATGPALGSLYDHLYGREPSD
jgi:pyruvate dehydrogenase E1 component alpha subunit